MSSGASPAAEPGPGDLTIVEVQDERDPTAVAALDLLVEAFAPTERQPIDEIAMEVAEKRLGLLTSYDFHLFAAVGTGGEVAGISAGVYLGGVDAGFVTYLAVRPEHRARQLGREMRRHLVDAFRDDARANAWDDLRWVLGEVRLENPWMRRLIRDRDAVPFDLEYYHPGVTPGHTDERWILYRQPIGDYRTELPVAEVRQILYAVWRRAYRVRWPLARDGFARMLEQLEGRDVVGPHPEFM